MEENNTKEVSTKALTIIEQAKNLVVRDGKDYVEAGEFCSRVKAVMKQAEESFDPIITKAHQAHTEAVAQKRKIYEPLKAIYVYVKGLMGNYKAEQEAIRQAEERRLQEIARKIEQERRAEELRILEEARKAEEDRLLAEAMEAEARGNKSQAEELIAQAESNFEIATKEAEEIIQAEVYVPPVIVPKETPKVAGISFREVWKFRVINQRLVPLEYLAPDMVKIGQVVRAMKNQAKIPGIEVYSERC